MDTIRCPICKSEFYHSCRRQVAAMGGRVKSDKKSAAARLNLERARAARLEKYQATHGEGVKSS
jgi:hypothetical protein